MTHRRLLIDLLFVGGALSVAAGMACWGPSKSEEKVTPTCSATPEQALVPTPHSTPTSELSAKVRWKVPETNYPGGPSSSYSGLLLP
jgi:hypothetical protein